MAVKRLTKLELQIMNMFWKRGPCSCREIQEEFPADGRPAYTTVQTTVYRLGTKGALRIVKRISNANIFDAAISRDEAQVRVIDELLALLDGQIQPMMAHLVKSGRLTLSDIQEAERALRPQANSFVGMATRVQASGHEPAGCAREAGRTQTGVEPGRHADAHRRQRQPAGSELDDTA